MISLIAAMLIAAAAPETAPGSAATPPLAGGASAAPAPKPKPEKICWDETPTGTHFSHRMCATRDQLEQRRHDDQDWKMNLRPVPAAGS